MAAVLERFASSQWQAQEDEFLPRCPLPPARSRPSQAVDALADESASQQSRLAVLAQQVAILRARWRPTADERFSSGLPTLDAAVGGGFVAGGLHEFLAHRGGAAAHTVALRIATGTAARLRWILYLDTTNDFFPPAAATLGVPLSRLLVIRTTRALDALWAAEQALRCKTIGAVILPLREIDAQASRRLQLAAEAGGGVGLLIRSQDRSGHTFAATRLKFDPVKPDPVDHFGESICRRTESRWVQVSVLKVREGKPPGPFILEIPDAPGDVSGVAVSRRPIGETTTRLASG